MWFLAEACPPFLCRYLTPAQSVASDETMKLLQLLCLRSIRVRDILMENIAACHKQFIFLCGALGKSMGLLAFALVSIDYPQLTKQQQCPYGCILTKRGCAPSIFSHTLCVQSTCGRFVHTCVTLACGES